MSHNIFLMQPNASDLKALADKIKNKFDFCNIYKEVAFLTHLNRALEIPVNWFKQLQHFKDRSEEEIVAILTSIMFFKYEEDNKMVPPRKMIRLDYNFSQNMLIVTGLFPTSLNKLLNYFQKKNKGHIQKIVQNQFYTLIDAFSKQNSDLLKGYLRYEKKKCDDRGINEFKIQNRKVRIMSIYEQDFFTFLIDIMAEYKSLCFAQSFNMQKGNKLFKVSYRPFFQVGLQQSSTCPNYQVNKKLEEQVKPNTKENLAFVKHREQDESSESTSLNQQMLETKDISDLTHDFTEVFSDKNFKTENQ